MKFRVIFLSAALGFSLAACSQTAQHQMPLGQNSFYSYELQTKDFVAENRHFVTDDKTAEIEGNSPFEIVPKHPNGKAILMIHGLGDSPWTYHDFARTLADQGYLVRAILLPGHGTKPQDMIGVTSEDWTRAVNEQMDLLKEKYKDIWIAGFSTGCNLAISYAEKYKDVSGLILFSPAVKVRTSLLPLAPFVNLFVTWLRKPDETTYNMGPFKYNNVPLDAIVAFKHTMDDADALLKEKKLDIPVVVMMTEHDSVVDTQDLLPLFDRQLANPASKIIWYGSVPKDLKLSEKVIVKTDYLPEERIKSFAHMSMSYSPDNPWYGANGKYRFCRNSMSAEDIKKCRESKEVWYGAWGTHDGTHPFARLTFNPYYNWQAAEILKVLSSVPSKTADSGIIKPSESSREP